ncbi:hypothetical protein [Tianweitania sediminis]|uniref:Uncharacterized protein n=1 Tax=Tianweitania sediminis TaxID=1502156 RepID=A0A8J7RSN9_9HYPH|nr:hypothetical protein [Tianweitania sediminis]MBP0441309.1 hypothetical protein [Tianweitania sediminis]
MSMSDFPKAGPKRLNQTAAYDAVLSRTVMLKKGDQREARTGEWAFILHLQNRSRAGDVGASELLGEFYQMLEDTRPTVAATQVIWIVAADKWVATDALRMTAKLESFTLRAERKLEPWVVEAALSRFGNRRLTVPEQEKIVRVTRTPHKVNWPEWWEAEPFQAKSH